jgi:hypothetical protein
MIDLYGDLFNPKSYLIQPLPTRGFLHTNISPDAICITTNGFVKKNGGAVMGRGCALEALYKFKYANLDLLLGSLISSDGAGKVHNLGKFKEINARLYAFPVKPDYTKFDGNNVVKHMINLFKIGNTVPGWAAKADLNIILNSARQLKTIADENNLTCIVIPRPGCGAGELEWKDVSKELNKILDSRFYSITFKNNNIT